MSDVGFILGRVDDRESNPAWVPGTYKPPPGATNDMGDLLEAMRAFGEAFTARQAGHVREGQDLMDEARDILGSAGVRLVLALLKAGRIPYPDAPWWPVFLSELVRHDPDEPLYVALPAGSSRPTPEDPVRRGDWLARLRAEAEAKHAPITPAEADELRALGLM